MCEEKYIFELLIYNDLTCGDQKLITITAKANYSLILSLKTIKDFNLSLICITYFTNLTTGRSLINLIDYVTINTCNPRGIVHRGYPGVPGATVR